jgi:predicted MFS family arabinose efflux permease
VTRVPSERAIVFLVGAVQFVNILDFMIVMPLGPDFARALHIAPSHLGYIGGSYTAAACVTGLLGSLFLDRFDRRSALGVAMLGLVVGTAMGGFATGLGTLLAARVIAGAFGGPATSISLSIIADVVPAERRGRAMGAVMTAFTLASIFGVPAALELAQRADWRLPFFSVAALGLVLAALAVFLLPPLRGHLDRAGSRADEPTLGEMLRRPTVVLTYLATVVTSVGMFALIPNISGYVQNNLHYPREHIGRLYGYGGAVTFAVLRVAGPLVDRFGPTRIAAPSTLLTAIVVYIGFLMVPPPIPVVLVFVGFMASTGFRNVALNTLASRVPQPVERARFMSIQSAAQHAACAVGAFLSSRILGTDARGALTHMDQVAWFTVAMILTLPLLMYRVERATTVTPPISPAG